MKPFLAALVFLAGALVGHFLHDRLDRLFAPAEAQQTSPAEDEEDQTIWTCSMDPQVRLDTFGLCPICGMDLIPLVGEDGGSEAQLVVSQREKARMRLETLPVQRRMISKEVRMSGRVAYDETRVARITAWAGGRIERLFVDFVGTRVQKGDHMVELYSPELYTTQEELLQALDSARRNGNDSDSMALVDAVRERLTAFGLTPGQIENLEESGRAESYITLHAPRGGVVVERNVSAGDYVEQGHPMFRIADPTRLWIVFDAYESDISWLRYGQEVSFEAQALPGERFEGIISFIDTALDPRTRTIKVRVVTGDPEIRLKPEMFVKASVQANVSTYGRVIDTNLAGKWISPMHPEVVKDDPGNCDVCGMALVTPESLGYLTEAPPEDQTPLIIPASAVLLTGKRAVVYVEVPDAETPTYEGREIRVGPRAGDYYVVESGLQEGELVVVEGNFKIDSALEIRAKPSMMIQMDDGGHSTTGSHGQMHR